MVGSQGVKSAAIQIRAPTNDNQGTDSPVSAEKKRETPQRICRNVMIYGYCKFQDAGCVYAHPPPGADLNAPGTPLTGCPAMTTSVPLAKDLTTTTATATKPSFGLGAEHLSAPVFVPKTPMGENSSPRAATPSLAPSNITHSPLPTTATAPSTAGMTPSWPALSNQGGIMPRQDNSLSFDESLLSMDPSQSSAMDGSMYMHQAIRQPLDQHLYVSPLPHLSNPPSNHHPLHSFFIPDDLRRMLQARNEAVYQGTQSGSSAGLPAELGIYHSLKIIRSPNQPPPQNPSTQNAPSKVYVHPAPVYKAVSSVDGNVYCLRRIEGYKLVNESAFGAIDTWRRMRHPNIVGLREAFTTKAFNDNSLILVYDYHPLSTTIWDEHLIPNPSVAQNSNVPSGRGRTGLPIQERVLWSYITQIANALKAIHSSGLAARNLDPSKILVTGKNRIRLNGCGVWDVLAYDPSTHVGHYQQEDLVSFGKLIISLCCDFFQPGQHPALPLDHIQRNYSPDVKTLVMFLISKPSPMKSVDEAIKIMGPRILNELDAMQNYADTLESDLGAQMENGRIIRLLTKLGFINERAEFELDPRWADTGDRYILKLFRDYVFHSVGVDGKPILDLSHVLTCLNKLDAGLDERIMLVSRDDQSCLVVTYREIKHCIEAAFK
uniref:PAN2-PAN3 deadenylation complex subunit PAN3 n=1 Tax=Kwoniella dejecticola CBS 10117 TaxID=1296121 RepID=A0A1A6ABM9_9TREE|nr:PAB-dependent poly(A)-specific ribonuclease subunit PAN3 [Kwoniella dejecticola CBS 10117]OBR87455.1 PAB-dependent poly(A)-specific ribonuclease subunit PAN3 [Kwoniella dejecticola CBS 10117]